MALVDALKDTDYTDKYFTNNLEMDFWTLSTPVANSFKRLKGLVTFE